MISADIIYTYFPQLTPAQHTQFEKMYALYADWNSRINVISRKDMDAFYVHHVLHSLSISMFVQFKEGTRILDVGTGGGFPGIPLAILFPHCSFMLVDSIGKKIQVVEAVAEGIGLTNVKAMQARVEGLESKYDFIVSRAVAEMKQIHTWTYKQLNKGSFNTIPNGWLLLKGGDLHEEIQNLGKKVVAQDISTYFKEEYFATKKIIYFS